MSVTIKRNTGWLGSGSTIVVKMNGEKVAKVAHEQQVEVFLSEDSAKLSVSQSGGKSNVVEVNDGETVEITSTKWAKASLFLPIICIFSTNLISSSMYRVLSLIAIVIFFISAAFLMKYFHLTVLDKKTRHKSD